MYGRDDQVLQNSVQIKTVESCPSSGDSAMAVKMKQILDFKIEIVTYILSNEFDNSQDIMRSIGTRKNPEGNVVVDLPSVCDEKPKQKLLQI